MEWVLVYLPASDAPPKSVPRDHFELNLAGKGFVLVGEDEDTPEEQPREEEDAD